jgi:hypothetical protein
MRNALAHVGRPGCRVASVFIASAFAQNDAHSLDRLDDANSIVRGREAVDLNGTDPGKVE